MRHAAVLGIIFIILIILAGLCMTAVDPEDFTGTWYSSKDQSLYLFQEGILYCAKNPIPLSESEHISGAYTFSQGSVFLFAKGIPGLEREKQLFLVRKDNCSFLCENPDGTGENFFIRYDQ